MRARTFAVLFLCLLACGCGKKATGELIDDLKSPHDKDRIIAVRTLPERRGEAVQIVPALIEALKDRDSDVRLSAAIGLGSFGEQAKEAIPALQAVQHDHDARVRNAARVALLRIEPANSDPAKP